MEKQPQKMRFNSNELSLFKNTFAENEHLLKCLRKVFLQVPLAPEEIKVVAGSLVGKQDVFALISKVFLPQIEPDAPFHQIVDLWMTVDIKEKTPEQAYPHLIARGILIDYLSQQLGKLAEVGTNTNSDFVIMFDTLTHPDKDPIAWYANLMARNMILAHVEQQLTQLNILAGAVTETVEQTMERLRKDSAK